jgi:uncharacterized protein
MEANNKKSLYLELLKQAERKYISNKQFIKVLKKRPPLNLDEVFKKLHNEVFSNLDCLECANCCKKLGPRITDMDISRLSKQTRLKPSFLMEQYFKTDEDGDIIFQRMPCPFLSEDNYCDVYQTRPKACRNYPHTNETGMHRLLDLTLKNSLYCPAVYLILEKLKQLQP